MHEDAVKICPKCDEEYSLEAAVCAECGGALEIASARDERPDPPEQQVEVVLIRQGTADYLRELGELLKKSKIPSYVRFHGCEPGT